MPEAARPREERADLARRRGHADQGHDLEDAGRAEIDLQL